MPTPHRLLAAAALATLTLTGAGACGDDTRQASPAEEIARDLRAERIAVDATTTVIDVRTPAEYAAGHLEGAVNIELGSATFGSRIAALDPAASYVLYCRSGSRSAQAAAEMASLGVDDVVDAGGLEQAAAMTGLAVTD